MTFEEWQNRFFPQMPSLLKRWKNSGYSQSEMDKITDEIVFKRIDPQPPQDEFTPQGCVRHYTMTKEQVKEMFDISTNNRSDNG